MAAEARKLVVELTQQCPNSCLHCSSDSDKSKTTRLEREQVYSLIDQAASEGFKKLVFSGGEPLIDPDLLSFVATARSKRLDVVIYTAASVLDESQCAVPVPSSLITALERFEVSFHLSLHALDPAVHNLLMGAPGGRSSEHAWQFLDKVGEVKRVEVHCVVTRLNYFEIEPLANALERRHVKALRLLRLIPQGRATKHLTELPPTTADWHLVSLQLERWQRMRTMGQRTLEIKLGSHLRNLSASVRSSYVSQYECSLDKNKLLVEPSGVFSVCPALKSHNRTSMNPPTIQTDGGVHNVLVGDWKERVEALKREYGATDCPACVIFERNSPAPVTNTGAPIELSDGELIRFASRNIGMMGFSVATTKQLSGAFSHFLKMEKAIPGLTLYQYSAKVDNENQSKGPGIADVWRGALIGALQVLKESDLRETPTRDNPDLFQQNLDTPDIADLYKYYGQAALFEPILYGLDGWYRDHFTHAVRVWLLCFFVAIRNLGDLRAPDFVPERSGDMGRRLFKVSELLACITVPALCHDLGYPLEKVAKLNSALGQVLESAGGMDWIPSRVTLSLARHDALRHLLEVLSATVEFHVLGHTPSTPQDIESEISSILPRYEKVASRQDFVELERKSNIRGSLRIRWSYLEKFSASAEKNAHGLISALLVARKLRFFKEGEFSLSSDHALTFEEARQFTIRRAMLGAMAAHTADDVYFLHSMGTESLLFFCDEIQEWSRPRFSDLRLGKTASIWPVVRLKEFSKKAVSWEVEAGEMDFEPALMWALTVARKLDERLTSAPDMGLRDFGVEWKLKWKSSGQEATAFFRSPARSNEGGVPAEEREFWVSSDGQDHVDMVPALERLSTGFDLRNTASWAARQLKPA